MRLLLENEADGLEVFDFFCQGLLLVGVGLVEQKQLMHLHATILVCDITDAMEAVPNQNVPLGLLQPPEAVALEDVSSLGKDALSKFLL